MAVSEQVQGGPAGVISGLIHGYVGAQNQQAQADLQQRTDQRDMMLRYLGAMANNQDVPPEHRQWALQKIQEGIGHDISKKPWEVKFSELPPITRQAPPQYTNTMLPGGSAPPPGISMPQPPQVGRADNGTVNALGASSLQTPQPPGPVVGMPVQTPPSGQPMLTPPSPPQQIAPGGSFHVATPGEKAQSARDLAQEDMNALRQQFPDKSPYELAYYSQHGEFPKPDEFTLGPGQERFQGGKLLARNEEAKPGTKSGYEPMMGPAGPVGVKDVATGGMLSPEQVASNPQAKAVWEQATKEHQRQLSEQEAKEGRQHAFELNKLTQTFVNALQMGDVNEAKRAATEGRKSYNDLNKQYLADQQRYNAMSTLYDDIQRNPTGNVGSFDAALIAFHMGMTVGAVKGMRQGRDLIMFHKNARGLDERLKTTFEGWINGAELSDEQRQNFVDLAHEKMQQEQETTDQAKQNYDQTFQEYQSRIGGLTRGRVKAKPTPGIKAPTAPPTTAPSQPPTIDMGLPPAARARLQEGHITTFANGQKWTLRGGRPEQVQGH